MRRTCIELSFLTFSVYLDYSISRMSNHTGSRKNRQELVVAVGRATQAYQRATDGFDDAVGTVLGLNPTDLRCLDWLSEGPMTAGDLAGATGLSTAATTTLLDRLEEKGYVQRERDTTDRRKVLARLTSEGERRLGSLYGPLAGEGARLLARFSQRELTMIRDFLDDATRVVQDQESHLRSTTTGLM
jgi:DNA-binding MarR family transcriptional regulator